MRQRSRQAENGQVVFGQADDKIVVASDFAVGVFIFHRRGVEPKDVVQKAVKRFAVVALIIVRTGIVIFVPLKVLFVAVELEERLNVEIHALFDHAGAKAAVIRGVVDEESRAGRTHGRELSVINALAEVAGVLLGIVAGVLGMFNGGGQRTKAGNGNGCSDAGIERAEDDGLPSAARKAGDGDARLVDPRVVVQVIEAAAHFDIKQAEAVRTGQVQMAYEAVVVLGRTQFTKPEPFQAERQHAAPRLINAAFLFVLDRFAAAAVAMHVEDRRHLSGDVFRLV